MYAIMVDYFIWDEEKQAEGREACYLFTTRDAYKIFIFDADINRDDVDLKTFKTKREANKYIVDHDLRNGICMDNVRVVKIK